MKKTVFLLMCSILLLSACGNAETAPSETESIMESSAESQAESENAESSVEESDDEWDKMHETEEKIKEFVSREEYKNAEKDKKVEMALELMEELQNDGFIQHYDYFEDNEMISYTHMNGVLGGISFHDFSEEIDGLAMN